MGTNFKKWVLFVLASAICLSLICSGTEAATAITIDDEEYNLFVDEYPDGVYNGIFAKFKTSKGDETDLYYLNFSSAESEEVFSSALSKSGINMTNRYACSMTATLYKEGEDEDVAKTDAVEVLMPIPDDIQDHPEACTFYQVSSGKVKTVSVTQCVDESDVKYIKFSLTAYTTYGFVYDDPESFEQDEEEEDEDELDEDDEDEDEDEDEDGDEDDVKPAATPTPVPKATEAPTKAPKDSEGGSSGSKNTSGTGSKTGSKTKDSIPKTGDDFPLAGIVTAGAAAAAVLAFAVWRLKKK